MDNSRTFSLKTNQSLFYDSVYFLDLHSGPSDSASSVIYGYTVCFVSNTAAGDLLRQECEMFALSRIMTLY